MFNLYCKNLQNIDGLEIIGSSYTDREHAAWLFTVNVEKRKDLQRQLRGHNIESNQVHF